MHRKYMEQLSSIAQMLVGSAFSAAAFGFIIIPQGFAAGGVTGLARVLSRFVPVSLAAVVLILNMALLVLGLIFVGRAFAAKTVALSVLFPILLEFFSRYPLYELCGDTMLSALAAGLLLGAGSGLILRSGASSGGFDVLAVILNRSFGTSVATVMNICDCIVIIMQALRAPMLNTAYGILVITLAAFVVNRVVTCGKDQSQVMVFSEHNEAIREVLLNELDVGVTFLEAESGYRQKRMKVIVSVMPYRKVVPMKKLITDINPTAFVVVDSIHSVLGRGYTLDKRFKMS